MFVPGAHARLHIQGIGGRRNKNRQKQARRKVGAREILRMPCLLPTIFVVFFGLIILAGIEVPIRKEPQPLQKSSEQPMETLMKALSISTPVLLMAPDLTPGTWRSAHHSYTYRGHPRHLALKPRHPKLKQLGGGGGGPGGGGEHEAWLKTSSLPNICDPESLKAQQAAGSEGCTQVAVLDHLQEVVRARRLRRFGRPSCSMDGTISVSLPQALSRSSSGVDNPAYLHEKTRRRSLSACMHISSFKTSVPRFVKSNQLQPRERLQQLQQQLIHKQRQLLLQQQEEQQQKKLKKVQRRDSIGSRGRRRDSDESRLSRPRPKLAQLRGAHKTFDCPGITSPTSCPADPPPFPLPAHFMQARQEPDSLPSHISSRTAKLLKAKCQSLDVRDKKTDVMLLKDLFRSMDTQDSPTPPSPPTSQTSSSSLVCIDPQEQIHADHPTEQLHQSAAVTIQKQKGNTASNKPLIGKKDSAFVRVIPSKLEGEIISNIDSANTHDLSKPKLNVSCTDDQRYELPLLSGVAQAHRQWEVERRRRIFRDSTTDHKSHSLDIKDTGPLVKMETARSKIHRSTSFKSPLAREAKRTHCKQDLNLLDRRSQVGVQEDRSSVLQVLNPQINKTRPKSWGGGKCPGTSISSAGAANVISSPITLDSMLLPLTLQTSSNVTENENMKHISGSSESACPGSPYPCKVVYDEEQEAGRTKPAVGRPQVQDWQCLKLPNRHPYSHIDHHSADRSSSSHLCQQQNQQLVVPVQIHPHAQLPKYLDPVKMERILNQGQQYQNQNKNQVERDVSAYELSVENHAETNTDLSQHDSMNVFNSKLGNPRHCQNKDPPTESHQPETARRRSTITHRASVHLSLDSYADSCMSMTSSTVSSTDNTNSSNVALVIPPSPATLSHNAYGVSGVRSSDSRGGAGVESSIPAMRRMRYTQSRSVAVELSADDEDTEDMPLIQIVHSSNASDTVGKS
ncbi:uncharacterized protein LOC143295366 isoform X2 [Babylonia areolata]|uniref:uncharacterized protein LOC143295366 isoform X2 n=1 Tax=Babylonia areolata TaxID=304850 RepID=UPI003FD54998